jgi:hypothetical protein
MKTQHCPASDANSIVRHHAQHQCAGGHARPVNHDAIACHTHTLEQIEERTDLTAWTAENAKSSAMAGALHTNTKMIVAARAVRIPHPFVRLQETS